MADSPEQLEAMFPRLDDAQVERLRAFGFEGRVDAGQIVFDQGDQTHGVFIVLDGSIQILQRIQRCARNPCACLSAACSPAK